jgi:hypothetical protein
LRTQPETAKPAPNRAETNRCGEGMSSKEAADPAAQDARATRVQIDAPPNRLTIGLARDCQRRG